MGSFSTSKGVLEVQGVSLEFFSQLLSGRVVDKVWNVLDMDGNGFLDAKGVYAAMTCIFMEGAVSWAYAGC